MLAHVSEAADLQRCNDLIWLKPAVDSCTQMSSCCRACTPCGRLFAFAAIMVMFAQYNDLMLQQTRYRLLFCGAQSVLQAPLQHLTLLRCVDISQSK